MKRSLNVIIIVFVLLLSSCVSSINQKHPKYVFMLIGDGMGLNQVQATEYYLSALNGKYEPTPLSFSNFPVQSYQTTYSANRLITCSSASGTALSTGHKTNNGVVCKDTSLTVNYETIAEKAKKAGYKIGILTSVGIDHATPAVYYAHEDKRSMYYEISLDLSQSGFDYFGGGGFHYPTGRDSTKENAYEIAKNRGYTITDTRKAFDALKNGDSRILAMNPELYPQGEFYWEIDKKEGSISLADFTKKAIEVLDNDKGFFMMVEGGKIDWACHSNDGASMIHETLAFADAVAEAVKFYNQHPDETLILVTADHETGGVVLGNGNAPKMGVFKHQKISAQEFIRLIANLKQENPEVTFDEVMQLTEKYFGLGNPDKGLALSDEEKAYLKAGYQETFKGESDENADKDYMAKKEGNNFPERVVALINKKAGLSWASYGHSATPVPVRALGVGQQEFCTMMDNTDIEKKIEKLMGI